MLLARQKNATLKKLHFGQFSLFVARLHYKNYYRSHFEILGKEFPQNLGNQENQEISLVKTREHLSKARGLFI